MRETLPHPLPNSCWLLALLGLLGLWRITPISAFIFMWPSPWPPPVSVSKFLLSYWMGAALLQYNLILTVSAKPLFLHKVTF